MQVSHNKTFKLQTELGNYCRTGINMPKTSIPEHTSEYRRLVYNVVKNTLDTAFPISQKWLGNKRWDKMVAHFFIEHKCQTPQVWKLPQEFSDYYQNNEFPFQKEFDGLRKLLQYEWLEIEVFMMEDEEIQPFEKERKSDHAFLVPNPEIRILPMDYPFHQKKIKDISVEDKDQYFVAIYRNLETKRVHILDMLYPYVEALVEINKDKISITQLYDLIGKYDEDKMKVKQLVDEFIHFAMKENILLGYQN